MAVVKLKDMGEQLHPTVYVDVITNPCSNPDAGLANFWCKGVLHAAHFFMCFVLVW